MKPLPAKLDVLVVGAGPCGLAAALALANAGVSVGIIDRAWKTSGESFACGLHPSTISLLDGLGMGDAARTSGLRISGLGIYDRGERMAAVALPENSSGQPRPPWVLPQDRLEAQLEAQLLQAGVPVHWGHRLDAFEQDAQGVSSVVEEIGFNSVGYPFPRTEEAVTRVRQVRTQFVLGADGAESHVRQCLGIGMETFGAPRVYDMIESRASRAPGSEARITFQSGVVDGFWPLPEWGCRWSLEVTTDSETVRAESRLGADSGGGAAARNALLEQRIRLRAPWYDGGIADVVWQAQVVFRRQLAAALGRDRVWLAGDAAHQSNPLGMHSMNLGLRESTELAGRMGDFLSGRTGWETFLSYDDACRTEWRRWLSAESAIRMDPGASDWVRHRRHQILMALPASGTDLQEWAAQLGMTST